MQLKQLYDVQQFDAHNDTQQQLGRLSRLTHMIYRKGQEQRQTSIKIVMKICFTTTPFGELV